MKRYCLSDLVCPLSGKPLQLIAIKEKPLDLSPLDKALLAQHGIAEQHAMSAVEEGILYSEQGRYWFPIVNFIPVLLDFPGPSLPRVQGTPRGERHRTAAPERHTSKGGIGYPTKLHR